MAFDYRNPNSKRFGSAGDHKATILKKVMADGKIKVYRDSQDSVERTEISVNDGKIVITKDYEAVARLSKFKKIDVYSNQDTLLDSIDIITDSSMIHSYKFYYHNSPVGRGYGEIAMCLTQSCLEGSVDPRLLAGSAIDPQVIETIQNILKGKSI
ncbi:MAG TPA: hypothetical protein VM077_00160 [Candidatus Limnocylindrales bacterium]|nr:hypothetical protein [Candidatus Limnocylindrales bacterium]